MVSTTLDALKALQPGDPLYELYEEARSFPYEVVNGVCSKLLPSGKCAVYKKRPDMCNMDIMFEKYYSHEGAKSFTERSIGICNALIVMGGLDPRFIIGATPETVNN